MRGDVANVVRGKPLVGSSPTGSAWHGSCASIGHADHVMAMPTNGDSRHGGKLVLKTRLGESLRVRFLESPLDRLDTIWLRCLARKLGSVVRAGGGGTAVLATTDSGSTSLPGTGRRPARRRSPSGESSIGCNPFGRFQNYSSQCRLYAWEADLATSQHLTDSSLA